MATPPAPDQLAARVIRAAVRRWHPRGGETWPALEHELDRRTTRAPFWWRDDDATTPTPQLCRLLALRERLGLPLGLAVIPADATMALADALPAEDVAVLVHGWSHANHARPGRPAAEFTADRPRPELDAQLRQALDRTTTLFGDRALPVLVPPFNAFAPQLAGAVRGAGYRMLSIDQDFASTRMPAVNVHADLVDWQRQTAASEASVVRSLVAALRLRRWGLVRADAPIGVMTHHLVHDDPTWALTEAILARLRQHPNVTFPKLPTMLVP